MAPLCSWFALLIFFERAWGQLHNFRLLILLAIDRSEDDALGYALAEHVMSRGFRLQEGFVETIHTILIDDLLWSEAHFTELVELAQLVIIHVCDFSNFLNCPIHSYVSLNCRLNTMWCTACDPVAVNKHVASECFFLSCTFATTANSLGVFVVLNVKVSHTTDLLVDADSRLFTASFALLIALVIWTFRVCRGPTWPDSPLGFDLMFIHLDLEQIELWATLEFSFEIRLSLLNWGLPVLIKLS